MSGSEDIKVVTNYSKDISPDGCSIPKISISLIFLFLLSILLIFPNFAAASGIGFRNHSGEISIQNTYLRDNFIGIQFSTTNVASAANKTIDNVWIDNNDILDSYRHGIRIDLNNTGAVTLLNNSLDNSNVPSVAPYTKNGRHGIRIENNTFPSISNNIIRNFGRSGIRFFSVNNSIIENNFLLSNGTQDYIENNQHFASGIQLLDSHIVTDSFIGNTIRWNSFSGVAAMNTDGTIGPNNVIMYNGDPDAVLGGGGSVQDCVLFAGGGGSVTGGVLARDLGSDVLEVCGNTITSNYNKNYAHQGTGTLNSCSNKVRGFFATRDDTVFFFDGDTGHVDLNCLEPGLLYSDRIDENSVIDAVAKPFGIIIEGSASDVTVRNCTIRNAATVKAATTGNGSVIGAGIFVANDATPSIANNYIHNNGWGVLEDKLIFTVSAGIQMRCAESNTSIINNIIASNANDGLVARESGAFIGVVNKGNTFRNNGRGGIGIFDGTTRNIQIAYNTIYNNKRGIGSIEFDGTMFTIANNVIYSNHADTTTAGGGIGITRIAAGGNIVISGNEIYGNSDLTTGGTGGIGFSDSSGGTVSLANNRISSNIGPIGGIGISASNGIFSFVNNEIMNNIGSSLDIGLHNLGGIGFNLVDNIASKIYLYGNTVRNNRAMVGGDRARARVGGIGFSVSNASVSLLNNTVYNNNAVCIGGVGFDLYGGTAVVSSNLIYNNSSNRSEWGAGGLAFDEASGDLTISDNTVYNNTNLATGSGGIALNALLATASVQLEGNRVYSNTGHKVGGIGVINPATSDVTLSGNTIFNNAESGIGIWSGVFINIQNNFVVSNGLADLQVGNEHYAAGIQLRDSTFVVNNINSNIIRYNRFAGIEVYNTVGSIGPDNIIKFNGAGLLECDIGGNGRGGVSVRELSVSNLTLANNIIQSNETKQVQLKPGCDGLSGEFYYKEGGTYSNISCLGTYWDNEHVGVLITAETIINHSCANKITEDANSITIDGCNASNAPIWGIAVIGENTKEVTIKNSNIYNNCLVDNNAGPKGESTGGGILVAAGADVYITNNNIYNNGFGEQPYGEGGFSGIVLRCSGTDNTIVNNSIYANANDGISLLDSHARIGLAGEENNIYSQGRHGIGLSGTTQNAWITYNYIYSNKRGIGAFEFEGDLFTIANNVIYSNQGSLSQGGIGINNFSGAAYIEGNTVRNNAAAKTGGIGLGTLDSATSIMVVNNSIHNNTSTGVGGLGVNLSDGIVTVVNNTIFNNESTGSSSGGLGFIQPGALASILVEENRIYSNKGFIVGAIGVTSSNTTDITIRYNTITNNDQSGIGIFESDYLTIQNNLILSNGLEEQFVNDVHNGFGIQLRDSIFAYDNIYSNTIRHNKYAGIGAYGVTGTIGPNNIIMYNGRQENSISCGVLGNGYGGVAARDLGGVLHIMDSIGAVYDEATNLIVDNYSKDAMLKPASTGSLTYNNQRINYKWVGPSDAVYYYDGIGASTGNIVHDCQGSVINAAGRAYGIVIIGENADVEVRNCTIQNAASTYFSLQDIGANDSMAGAGMLVAIGPKAYIHDNLLEDNGFDMTRGRMTDSGGITVVDYFWSGGAAVDERGENELWIRANSLTGGQQEIFYFYSGDPTQPAISGVDRVNNTYYKINEAHAASGLVSYWTYDTDLVDDGPYGYNGTSVLAAGSTNTAGVNYYGNDFRFVMGLIWQNQRMGSIKSLRLEENFGEDNYVMVGSPSSNLNIAQDQTIVFWFSPIGDGPAYTRETTSLQSGKYGTGGVEVSIEPVGSVKFKIASLGDTQVYSCKSPEDYFEYGDNFRANSAMVAAVYDYDAIVSGKMKLYIQDTLVASTDVPAGFSPGYDSNSKSYLAAADVDNDGSIEVGETYYGLLDETAVFNEALSYKRIEALHYHREYDTSVEANGWPTVAMGDSEDASGITLSDGTQFPNRWPITVNNITANLSNFQVGPAYVASADSGGLTMRCVDERTTVTNNTFNANRQDGIAGYSMDGTTIANNIVTWNERFGIGMRETIQNVNVFSNYVYKNDRGIGGFDIRRGSAPYSITNNHLDDNDLADHGWKRFAISFTVSNPWVYVLNNTIENGKNGIGWQGSNGGGGEVIIENNDIQNNLGNPIAIEKLDPGNKILINDNNIWGNNSPVRIRYMDGNDTTVQNNLFDGYWAAGNKRRGYNHGFQCIGCGYITIQNNTFQNFGYHNKGTDKFAAIRFELQAEDSGAVIDGNTIQNNRMNGISFQDCSGTQESVSITNNYLFNNGCRRVGKKANDNCQPTATPDGDSKGKHFTIDNLSAIQFRDIDNLGMLYIADNNIDSNYCDGVKFENNDYSNVTLDNNTITNNVSYFWGSSPVNESATLQATNTTVTTGNITTVTTLQYDIINSSGKNYVDTITLSNNPNLGVDDEYLGLHLQFATPADPTDVEIYSYDSSNNIAWVSYESGGDSYTTFANKPAGSASFTMDDPNYVYLDSGVITLANSANAADSYYNGLMITIDNFASGVSIAASQLGSADTLTLQNASTIDNYYAGYHLIDVGADPDTGVEYNLINSFEGSTGIAFMNVDYETKPSGTCDIGYPIKYINEYDGTVKVVEVGGSYINVPSGVGYTIAGGVTASSGYVDGTGMQFRDIIDGTLLIKNTTITNNWRGMWFRDIPNTNNNFSNPNVVIQGSVVEYNMGIGIRADEVAWIMIGDPDYVPNVYWSGGCGKTAGYYSKANGMTHGAAGLQPGLFYRPDGGNTSCRAPKRDAWVADAMANGGTSVYKNGSWGVQMRGDNQAYKGNVWFNGGQMRGNSSNGIGVQGGDVHVTVSNVFFGGNADAVATRGGGVVILDNVVVMGSDAVESQGSGTFYLRNYSYVHTKARSASQGYLQSHSYVACMQICQIYQHGQGGGNLDISDYGYLETGRFIGGGPTFHNHGGFGMVSGEHSSGIKMYDGAFGGCYGGRRNGHRFWGYESLWSSAIPHPNNVNSLGGCMPVAEAAVIQGNNVYGGITYARHGHDIGWNYVQGSISPAAGDSSAYIHDNWSGDPATNAIDCGHPGSCPNSARCP